MFKTLFLSFFLLIISLHGDNQTDTVSPVYPPNAVPFVVSIELADFSLPLGIQSYVYAIFDGKWILLSGRTNGLHGFDPSGDFPPSSQNTVVYVVDPSNGVSWQRSLLDPSLGLSQQQIDCLSATSCEANQVGNTLYVVGGYGVDTPTGTFGTKSTLTAIDLPSFTQWVMQSGSAAPKKPIRTISHPLLQVTGGYMGQGKGHLLTLLIFGQNFDGDYSPSSNGNYTQQVRSFRILDNGKSLYIEPKIAKGQNPNYRRRDLNVVPILQKKGGQLQSAFVAYAGVFTLSGGAWTVPVTISQDGNSNMSLDPNAFQQAMNQYICPNFGLYSVKSNEMYTVLPGGISYGFFENGVFETDSELPFINQVTTIKIDSKGQFSQYIMENQYPLILSTFSNPGNPLLFGAGAQFFASGNLPAFDNGVLQLDKLNGRILVGYIVGGIQSTLPNTNTSSDSAASPYIFSVYLQPR